MKRSVIYIHGKGGSADEAEHYVPLFAGYDVIGFDYRSDKPWQAKEEFPRYFDRIFDEYDEVILVANSVGAYFSMHALSGYGFERAFLISPVADMERLIENMMMQAGVSEEELREKKIIPVEFGEPLSWEYLTYVRENPIVWGIPAFILYGENDELTSLETIDGFARKIKAELTVMPKGEHWFHTEEQMAFLDAWINSHIRQKEGTK